jgi:hypothetical protein
MTYILFHVTNAENAKAILRDGFRDGHGSYMTDHEFSGVWLSNEPLGECEGAWGDTVLTVAFTITEAELNFHEWVEEGKPYREWLIPAQIIKQFATVAVVENSDHCDPM